jgi:hypothetical protein
VSLRIGTHASGVLSPDRINSTPEACVSNRSQTKVCATPWEPSFNTSFIV